MSIVQKLKDATIPSVYAAVAGVGIYYLTINQNLGDKVPFANTLLPEWAAIGGSVFLGAELGSILTEFVGPKIGAGELADKVLPPVMTGASVYLVMSQLISENTNMGAAFLVGAGADVAGKYVYGMWGGRQY